MSTITKLDPVVRVRRADRRSQRINMASDIREIEILITRGKRKYPDATVRQMMQKLYLALTVTKLTLKQITKLCKDSTRTGERKHAILEQLGTAKYSLSSEY